MSVGLERIVEWLCCHPPGCYVVVALLWVRDIRKERAHR